MTKKTKKSGQKITHLVDRRIDVPEDAQHFVNNPDGKFSILLNRRVIELVRTIAGELIMARGLPADPETTAITDPMALYINQKRTWLSPNQAIRAAVHYYSEQHQDCNRDAMLIALTDNNDLSNLPTPYEAGDLDDGNAATAEDGTVPSWRQGLDDMSLPKPQRDLNNPYERRLKQIYDFLDEAGVMFSAEFYAALNDAMGQTLRLLGEDTDEAGFPTEPPGQPVPVSVVPESDGAGDGARGTTPA